MQMLAPECREDATLLPPVRAGEDSLFRFLNTRRRVRSYVCFLKTKIYEMIVLKAYD